MHVTLHDGWTRRDLSADRPRRRRRRADSRDRARLRAPRPAGRRPDRRPVPRRQRARLVAWIGRADWRYETDVRPGRRRRRRRASTWSLEGLDTRRDDRAQRRRGRPAPPTCTAATASTSARCCAPGANTLAITFAAPADRRRARPAIALGPRPHVNTHPFNAIRKMACNFGWDWGPDLVTAGIWRPVSLQTWTRRPDRVGPAAGRRRRRPPACCDAHVDVERATGVDGR